MKRIIIIIIIIVTSEEKEKAERWIRTFEQYIARSMYPVTTRTIVGSTSIEIFPTEVQVVLYKIYTTSLRPAQEGLSITLSSEEKFRFARSYPNFQIIFYGLFIFRKLTAFTNLYKYSTWYKYKYKYKYEYKSQVSRAKDCFRWLRSGGVDSVDRFVVGVPN